MATNDFLLNPPHFSFQNGKVESRASQLSLSSHALILLSFKFSRHFFSPNISRKVV